MGHNLNFNEQTGKYSFYSLKEKAWHGYGQISKKALTSKEVIEQAQLNFTVEKAPHIYRFLSGKEVISTDTFYTYRTDTEQILGDGLSADYTVLQNVDAFAFFDEIVKGEGVIFQTAGALSKGEKIFITAKLPRYIRVGNDDVIEQYLFLTTSHDGKESITIAFTPVRIVCNNTLNAALANCSNVIKIKHSSNLEQQLKEVPKIMSMVNTLNPIMEQAFNQMAKVKITDKQVQRLIQVALAPDKETLDNIRDGKEIENSTTYKNQVYSALGYSLSADSQQLDTTKGTLFGAYNGITGYFHNVRNYNSDEDKINSLLCGGTAQKKGQRTFDLCMEFARNGEDALLLN